MKPCPYCSTPFGSTNGRKQYCTLRCTRLAAKRRANLRKAGWTPEGYDTAYLAQGGRCAICDYPAPKGGRKGLQADHNHTTGTARGLLCLACNWYVVPRLEKHDVRNRALAYVGVGEGWV